MRRSSGITLIEVMVSMGVVVLLYAVMGFTTIQIANFTRQGGERARHKARMMKLSEQLRWQLRCLQEVPGQIPLKASAGGRDGRAELRFYTHSGYKFRGVVEVGYRIQEVFAEGGARELALVYREFPFADSKGLRALLDHQNGPWEPVEVGVSAMKLEFSNEGRLWQRDWEEDKAPTFVRIYLEDQNGQSVVFDVSPGVRGKRW